MAARKKRIDNGPDSMYAGAKGGAFYSERPRPERPDQLIERYFKENFMEYREHLEKRRGTLTPDALEIYREACRQQNVKTRGVFVPLGKVELDDGKMLSEHSRFMDVAEALTSTPFEPISKEDYEAAELYFSTRSDTKKEGTSK
jgi:hypothetical protein